MGIISPPRLPDGPCAEYDDDDLAVAIRYALQCIGLEHPSEFLHQLLAEAGGREAAAAARFRP